MTDATINTTWTAARQPRAELKAARRAVQTLFFLNGVLFATWAARVPAVKEAHHLSDGALGLSLLAIALGAVISMPITGGFCARVGSDKVCKATAALYCVLLPLLALMPNMPLLVISLFCFGVAHAGLDVAMNAQAVDVEKQYHQPIMSSFHALWSTGGLVGAALGGLLAGQGLGLLSHFALMAAVFALATVFTAPRLLDSRAQAQTAQAAEPAAMFAWPTGGLLILGLIALCVMMGEGAMADWSAVYLKSNIGTNVTLAAWGYAAFSLAMAVGRYGGDLLSSRFGAAALVRTGTATAAAGLLLALLVARAGVVLLGFGLVGIGFATVVPMVFSAAGRKPGIAAGVAIASVSTLGYLGFLIGPPFIGFAAQLLGLRTALGIIVVTSLAAALLTGVKSGLGSEKR